MKHPCVKCSHLGITYNKKWKLEKHSREVHQEETDYRFHCDNEGCDYQTDNRKNFIQHQQENTTCPQSGKALLSPPPQIRRTSQQTGITPTLPYTQHTTHRPAPQDLQQDPCKCHSSTQQVEKNLGAAVQQTLKTSSATNTNTEPQNDNDQYNQLQQSTAKYQPGQQQYRNCYTFTCNIQLQMCVTVDRDTG